MWGLWRSPNFKVGGLEEQVLKTTPIINFLYRGLFYTLLGIVGVFI